MKKYIILFGIIFFCSSLKIFGISLDSIPTHRTQTLIIGSEIYYPPYCILDKDNNPSGFSIELIKAACEVMGYQVQFKVGPWSQMKQDLALGKIDALPLVARIEEREKLYDFTFPYITMHGTIVVRDDEYGINSLEDLKNKQVAVLKGDVAEEYLRRNDFGAEIVTTHTFKEALIELTNGDHDAVVAQKLLALQLIKEIDAKNLKTLRNPIEGFSESYCFAVEKGNKNLLDILNEGLSITMADGTFRRLQTKWFYPIEQEKQNKSTLIFGGDVNYPPFEFLDKNGEPTGYNVDLTKALGKQLGLTVEIQLGSWTETLEKLKNKEIDVVQGIYYTPERSLIYNMSPAHTIISQAIVIRKGEDVPKGFDNLNGKSILVQKGDVMHDLAIEQGYENQLIVVPTQEEALRILASGKYDCALVAKLPAYYWMDKYEWNNLFVIEQSILSPEYCYGVSYGNEVLLVKLTEGMAELKASGEYRKIYSKWFGTYDDQFRINDMIRYSLWVVIPFFLMLIGSFIWSKTLQRRIAKRTAELQQEINERKKAEHAVKENEAKLIELVATKDKFFSIIAHDLRSPFNAILGFSDQLSQNIKNYSTERVERMASLIYSSSKNTYDLLVNLLEWANFQRGMVPFNPEFIFLKDLFKEIQALHKEMAIQKGIDLVCHVDDGLSVFVDREMMLTILRNLVSNAIKFTHNKGTVGLSAVVLQEMIEIIVLDTGVGMDEETKLNLFRHDVNATSRGTANEKGTGLGLLLCQEFIEKHGGTIWAESETGQGSSFKFTIPVKDL